MSVRYRVYAHEMSVRTNWVDDEMALAQRRADLHHAGRIALATRARSADRAAALVDAKLLGHGAGTGERTSTSRADYDTLVDSPIVAGAPSVYEFSVQGKPHYLVNFRERGVWNGPQAARISRP